MAMCMWGEFGDDPCPYRSGTFLGRTLVSRNRRSLPAAPARSRGRAHGLTDAVSGPSGEGWYGSMCSNVGGEGTAPHLYPSPSSLRRGCGDLQVVNLPLDRSASQTLTLCPCVRASAIRTAP
eukprot:5850262-Prymnesium_polylepis.1